MFCNFIEITPGTYRCTNCDIVISVDDEYEDLPVFPCGKSLLVNSNKELINTVNSLAYEKSSIKCTEEQIISRHNICSQCEHFINGSCNLCGCMITRNKDYANKLLWSDDECPIGKWGKVTD